MDRQLDRAGFVAAAFEMNETVVQFANRARAYYYLVALSGHTCPQCNGALAMIGESRCRCQSCSAQYDPTVMFQRCSACGGEARLRVRRYHCSSCGADVPSRFVFEGLVFDADYFRQKIAEHRQRAAERLERVREMLAASRSPVLVAGPLDSVTSADLFEALNALVADTPAASPFETKSEFDLRAYQSHVQGHIGPFALSLDEIPALRADDRLDRIWRFIAIVFLMQEGLLLAWQEGSEVMVMQRETDREGQDVPGELEEADGVEGFVG
jgi:hypothetical protein